MSQALLIEDAPAVRSEAELSPCGRFRYSLLREWNPCLSRLCIVMLNPSTADASVNDPTILKCMALARRWDYGSIEVVNLFALRTPHPTVLFAADDPGGGFHNDHFIERAVKRSLEVLVAWGNGGNFRDRDRDALRLIRCYRGPLCLGLTQSGMPIHPSARGKYRVPDDCQPVAYEERLS